MQCGAVEISRDKSAHRPTRSASPPQSRRPSIGKGPRSADRPNAKKRRELPGQWNERTFSVLLHCFHLHPPLRIDREKSRTCQKSPPPIDLEVKDAQLIFNSVWKDLEIEYGKLQLRFPKELILLGGAPGAGKGTNTDYIRKVRDITEPPIVVSELLNSPEAPHNQGSRRDGR